MEVKTTIIWLIALAIFVFWRKLWALGEKTFKEYKGKTQQQLDKVEQRKDKSDNIIPFKANTAKKYDKDAIWYDRMEALEELCLVDIEITKDMIDDLNQIAVNEDDWRIRELAIDMTESYRKNESFKLTYPYKDYIAENMRKSVKLKGAV